MLSNFIKKIRNSELIKNIAVLASGVAIGYAINMVLLPIISRIYTPSQLGEYDLILSIGNIIISFVSLALVIAIMLPKEDDTAVKICKVIRMSTIVFLLAFLAFIYITEPYYRIFEISTNYWIACWLLVAYVWFFNQQNLYYTFVNRKKLYQVLFWNPIIAAVANSGFSILFGIWGWGTAGYLSGTILSYLVCIIHMRTKVNPFSGRHSFGELWHTLKNYRVYPLIQLPTNMISTVSAQLPIQFLGRMFSTAALGGYTMACKLLSVPVGLLATPVNRVYYREAVDKKNSGEDIGEFCFNVIEKNIKIAIIPIAIMIIFGREIVTLFLGKKWEVSGVYISILGILYLLKYCSSCLSGTLVILGKQRAALICSIWQLFQYVACFWIAGVFSLSVVDTIIFYAVLDGIYNFVNISLCMYYGRSDLKKFLIFVLKYVIGSAVIIYGFYFIV